MKKKIISIVTLLLFITLSIINVKADNPFITQTVDRFDELVETQDAYESILKIKNIETGSEIITLNKPNDLFTDKDGYHYIADTDNKQIVILDSTLKYVTSTKESLIKPSGLYVRDNLVYVADYGDANDAKSGKVVIFNFDKETKNLELKEERSTPSSKVLEIDNFIYRPEKIAVDSNLTMYVVSEGSYNGVLTINNENRFMSYFAPNNVTTSLKEKITRFLYGDNDKVILKDILPAAPYNVCVDDSGYIYTVTQTVVKNDIGDTLKKVNIGGLNFYPTKMLASSEFVSVWTGKYGNVFAATKNGYIYEYDLEGNIIFIFGGKSIETDQLGLFKSISAITVTSNDELMILDKNDGSIQVFRPTNFTNTIHTALGLYNEGRYNESKDLWEEVLVYNAMTDVAHKGIGLAHYMNAEYEEALEQFKLANAKKEYSDAFWEIRNIWLQEHLGLVLGVIIIFIVIVFGYSYINKKYNIKENVKTKINNYKKHLWFRDICLMLGMLNKPLDSNYYIKTDKKIKYYNGIVILLLFFGIYILGLTCTGFTFNNVVIEKTILLKEALKVIIPIILFVVANYLTSSLIEGEGTLKAIFLTTIGCLMPVIIIYPIVILLSNVLTFNESFIYYFGLIIMIGWSLVLLFVVNKELHNYSFGKMILNLIVTVLLMFVILIVVILCYLMVSQIVEFIKDIISEVIFNG